MDATTHLSGFLDFVAFETAAAGPSPNLHLIEEAGRLLETREERAWFAACYCAIYNTPGALLLFHETSRSPAALLEHWEDVRMWLNDNKAGIPVHSNRLRTHGSMDKLAAGLKSLAEFVIADDWERGEDYDRLWAQVNEVNAVGRYFGIKFAGALKRLGVTDAHQYDIRARGAKNGRKTLALIFPDEAELLDLKTGGNSKLAINTAEARAAEVRMAINAEGLGADWFQLEALLCEQNQMVKGDRYPGKTSDSDLGALRRVEEHFGATHVAVTETWRARAEALPPFAYELEKRKPLLDVYQKYGYCWSDALYDYDATLASGDFSRPVLLSEPKTAWQPKLQPPAYG